MNFEFIFASFPQVLMAIPTTLGVTVASVLLAIPLALAVAIVRMRKVPVLSPIATGYLSVMRGVPLLVTIYVAYYALPYGIQALGESLGVPLSIQDVPPLVYGIAAFTLDTAAYLSEVFRSAILSVEKGQREACISVGMTSFQAYRRVLLPQALVIAIPPFGNAFIGVLKGSSLLFMISIMEITAVSNSLAYEGYNFIEAFFMASLCYWGLCVLFERLFLLLERAAGKFRREAVL